MEKVDEGVRLSRRSLPYDKDDYNWIDGFFFFLQGTHAAELLFLTSTSRILHSAFDLDRGHG